MKTRLLIMVAAALWSVTASGQIDPNSDGIGIYADLDGLTNQVELEVGVPMEVYLLMTSPTGLGELGGWECSLVVPDNIAVWGWNVVTPGALTVSDPPSFAVGFPTLHTYQDIHHLMTFIIVPQDSESAQFYIKEFEGQPGGDFPRYADFDPSYEYGSILKDLKPYPDGMGKASFTVNPESLAVASATWGEVKALYR